jgi:hypothetical protein
VRFEWDTEKEKANVTKHGVDFTEATAAFYDPKAVISADEEHGAIGSAAFLHRSHRTRDSNRSLYLSRRDHSDHRRWLLEERKENL